MTALGLSQGVRGLVYCIVLDKYNLRYFNYGYLT